MYTTQDAHMEISTMIDETLEHRDVEKAYKLADIFADQGDDESAHHFRMMARTWEREDNYHDRDN